MHTCQEKKAKVFKALCDPKRIAIVELLRTGEKCACVLSEDLGIAQSALSYHMKILCESQLVRSWYVGKWTHYEINVAGCEYAMTLLQQITQIDTNAKSERCSKPHKACSA